MCSAAAAQALSGAGAAPAPAAAAAAADAPAAATPTAALTHAVSYLAHLTEFFRGSRVGDFAPLFRTLRALLANAAAWPPAPPADDGRPDAGDPPVTLMLSNPDETTPADAFVGATAPGQVLRLALAITQSHGKVAGASGGPEALAAATREDGSWAALFVRAPWREFEAFATSLLQPPTPREAAAVLLPQTLAELERRAVRAGRDPRMLDVPLGLLVHAHATGDALPPPPALPGSAGVSEGGDSVDGAAACDLAEVFAASHGVQHAADPMHACVVMGALQWLTHVQGEGLRERALGAAMAVFQSAVPVISGAAGAIADPVGEVVEGGSGSTASATAATAEGYSGLSQALASVVVQTACRAACDAAARAPSRAGASAEACQGELHAGLLRVLQQHPVNYAAVSAMADLCTRSGLSGADIFCAPGSAAEGVTQMERRDACRAALQQNLRSPSRALRAQTLRVLLRDAADAAPTGAAAPDSHMHDSSDDGDAPGEAAPAAPGVGVREQLVRGFLECEERPLGLEAGRAGVAWLRRVAAMLEYGHVPADSVALTTLGLLGMTHLKYGELRCAPPRPHGGCPCITRCCQALQAFALIRRCTQHMH